MNLTCHCGNVEIETQFDAKEVVHCNCSICRRYAAAWAYYDVGDVSIRCHKEASVYYLWGDKEVAFHRCNLCGCLTHYKTTEKCDVNKMAVNMRLAASEVLADLPMRRVDGATF